MANIHICKQIYKQTILYIVEYVDLLVIKSGPSEKVSRLQNLQNGSVCIIDNRKNNDLGANHLSNLYRLTQLKE